MRIYGICKIRNEEKIIWDTLSHWGGFCSGGIFVVDDQSEDRTVELCTKHPAVKGMASVVWSPDRETAEYHNRQMALEMAQEEAGPEDWICYFDADERLYNFDFSLLFDKKTDAIYCRLYDIYITPEDVHLDYCQRNLVGPEYRSIPFFFRNSPALKYDKPDQRIVDLPENAVVVFGGIVKHYGKGLSVEDWEKTCSYYINYWPKYAEKWKARQGKAVHDYISDFGNPLIKFNEVLEGREEGFPLESQSYGRK